MMKCLFTILLINFCSVIYSQIDTDNDGMPDAWENDNGLDINDPSDAYGDQVYNLYEFLLSADPQNIDLPASISIHVTTTTTELQGLINATNANVRLVIKLQEEVYTDLSMQFSK